MKIISLPFIFFSLLSVAWAASRPECFPVSPACLRPQVHECRDAIMKMRHTDPGYVTIFGRHPPHRRNTIDVPRVWHSDPRNCAVKLDVVLPAATDSFRLQTLTLQGEEIIAACIIGGNHCGGAMNVGPNKVMQLQVGYYAAIAPSWRTMRPLTNVSLPLLPIAVNFTSNNGDDATASS